MSTVVDDELEKKGDEENEEEPRVGQTVLIDEHGDPIPPSEPQSPETRKRPLYRRPAFLIIAIVVFVVACVLGIRYWLYARSHESTDDAFIDAHVIQVSPKVSGYIVKVYVDSNQQVNKGDLLAEIDPRDYQARLDQAKAA